MQIQRADETIFRHGAMAGTVIAVNVIFVPFAICALVSVRNENTVGAAVISVVLWSLWLFGWRSKVVITSAGITLDSVFPGRSYRGTNWPISMLREACHSS